MQQETCEPGLCFGDVSCGAGHDGLHGINPGLEAAGIADQFQLKVRPERTLYESVGDSFGYLVKNGAPSLMKLLTTEQEDSHEE